MPVIKKDKSARVFAKATSWRFFATCDTILLSWIFTGQIGTALRIGVTEVATKIGLFYLHERIWDKLSFGRTYTQENNEVIVHDKHYRSVVKGASWRFFGTLDTMIIALLWTGDYTKALAIGVTEVVTKIALFWLHERAWLKIKWGKEERVLDETKVAAQVNFSTVKATTA
ncbi:DUF2061 domain-containing protein [Foetidibacter luteolus]|uniref:DUF2061 domain-containing protein n=1 Tax=Foetidibacter luteolus TaxID=2608880 RepID=UPI00129A7EA7|nr:DUF2061 domain-containing protein [Foetidibacter luteolus]